MARKSPIARPVAAKRKSRSEVVSLAAVTAPDEANAWAVVSALAQSAYSFWKGYLVLRRGAQSADALTSADDQEFLLAIRAVSWVESAHGTGAGFSAARDPMQCGNPQDSWWKQITGSSAQFDRFVRGGSGSVNYNANQLPAAVASAAGWDATANLSTLAQSIMGHGTASDDNHYTRTFRRHGSSSEATRSRPRSLLSAIDFHPTSSQKGGAMGEELKRRNRMTCFTSRDISNRAT